ncbi:uncharacterized protein BP01DRAFT_380853 [Aspergillus saccharolyticus JOP 1030-1]|uniref:Uncharacterized protein n=1 Tax=Aspergillus saccharolyticus JOP 1030-1 TaxID=1450539 RepID=A0A318ZUH9_9EURO|nr:hypothetical protein BP01DRAFT_380853 [Aspergillus saccharolyticus JOP 1030-1]PYH47650.1 hypothetical protein BP01DRAFT_380853 [Aspergillus saccharolyticus JOP 1030-1]
MTRQEAHAIIGQLQEQEFPHAFNKARKIALIKSQNNKRNSEKRYVLSEYFIKV